VTNDAFLASLKSDWCEGSSREEAIARGFVRHRRWAWWTSLSGALGSICVLAGFVWFAWMALEHRDPLFAVSTLAFAAGLAAIVTGLLTLRRGMGLRYDETPLGLFRQNRDRLNLSRRLLFGARCCAGILAAATAAALLLTTLSEPRHVVVFLPIAAWGVTALAVWIWQARRKQRLEYEIAALDSQIAEFEEADAAGGP
jgi:magnesium-transporting ATPase (P-type)